MRKVFGILYVALLLGAAIAFGFDAFGVRTVVCALLNIDPSMLAGVGLAAAVVAPFPVDSELTSVALAYHNKMFIADDVLPRRPVGAQNFKYRSFAKGTFMTIPDTKVGRRSAPNQVELGFTEVESSCFDYGLDDLVPNADIENAPQGYDPISAAAEFVADLIELDREKRAADMVFDSDNYGSSNKTTLSGTSQWSDGTNSTPISDIMTGLDACVMRPNVAVFGRASWSKLAQHPEIVKATNRNSGDSGVAARQAVAELFELEEVLVGESFYNTVKQGQTPSLSRLWGKHAAFIFRNRVADVNRGVTFGLTAQWGTRIAGQIDEPKVGLRGSKLVRVGESLREVIMANDLGYLVVNAVA